MSYVDILNQQIEEYLEHTGTPQPYDYAPIGSGRYRKGSGENPLQHPHDFLDEVEKKRAQGFTWIDPKDGKLYSGDAAIYKSKGMTSTEFRTEIGLVKAERRMAMIKKARTMHDHDGLGNSEIARRLSSDDDPINESTVREWLKADAEVKARAAWATADMLKEAVDKSTNGMVDVGNGVERELGISKEKLNQALYILKRDGYEVYGGRFDQVTNPGQMTTQKVLCTPGHEKKDIYNLSEVDTIMDYTSRDGGNTYGKRFYYPEAIDSSRVKILYREEGGTTKDGMVELRPGCPDLDLGGSMYAQVRILVDCPDGQKRYIKGMALYNNNLPDGVDILVNSNKAMSKGWDALKPIKDDPENPFGAAIKDAREGGQYFYTDPKTGEQKLGLINKRSDEGDWSDWKNAVPSQFLSKQSEDLAARQLNLAKAEKQAEFDSIMDIQHPTIRKYYLDKFAESADAAAVSLQGAALPGQRYHAIFSNPTLKEDEIYAPGYKDGTMLACVRYPHQGIFEIPILKVNNKNQVGIESLGKTPVDAVMIHPNVANQLSGADFDGDTVMCIPCGKGTGIDIRNRAPLPGLVGYEPKDLYGPVKEVKDANGKLHCYDKYGTEYPIMRNTQTEMGVITNLVTDMTFQGATDDELTRAVRYAQTVIDAEKHHLNYKQVFVDERIAELHEKYQGRAQGGAATIISRAKGQQTIDKTQGTPKVNVKGTEWYKEEEYNQYSKKMEAKPEGSLIFKPADDLTYPRQRFNKETMQRTYTDINGNKIIVNVKDEGEVKRFKPHMEINKDTGEQEWFNEDHTVQYKTDRRHQKTTKMAAVDDANLLMRADPTEMEKIYATYANDMKAMARQARLESYNTGKVAYSKQAHDAYINEVKSLDAKLNTALLNTGRERAANRSAAAQVQDYKNTHKDASNGDIKKQGQRALSKYRDEYGSISRKDRNIVVTDPEWKAIMAGAISTSKLEKLLANCDPDTLRAKAMPQPSKTLSAGQEARVKAMAASGYTLQEIADAVGKSPTTVSRLLKGE